jgi:plastocyanin
MESKRRMGISVAGPLLAVLIFASIGAFWYMQFMYLPTITAEEAVPENIANPPESAAVEIVKGSYNIQQAETYVPKEITVVLGKNNKVVWKNVDEVAHTVTADAGQSGKFVQEASRSRFLQAGEDWEFVFTKEGTYKYHCEPHPWMKGTVIVQADGGA